MKISAAIITLQRGAQYRARDGEPAVLRRGRGGGQRIDRPHGGAGNKTGRSCSGHGNWRGYAGQKNYASECCKYDWVLSLDADEALSEALEAEIWQIKKNGPEFDAYTMPRLAQYLGRWILHSGWYPDRKVRLFDRRKAKWVGNYVHESVVVEGRIGHLNSNILHFTCSSLSEHLKTMDRYTTLAAEQLVAQNTEVGWTELALDPPWTFFRTYVLQRGFLDGIEGLAIALHGGALQFLEVRQGQEHGPAKVVVHTLHIDTGREMRGGQWQALYLLLGLAERGHRVRLLAPAGSPLLQAALAQQLDARPLRVKDLAGAWSGADLIHAHDARAHTLAVLYGKTCDGFAARGFPGAAEVRLRAGSTAGRRISSRFPNT